MRAHAAALAALMLVACGSRDGNVSNTAGGNAAGGPTGNASGTAPTAPGPSAPIPPGDPSAQSIQPGQWEMASRMDTLEAPGAPPAMVAQMRAQLPNQRSTQRQCITPEQAANPARNLVGRNATSQGCTFADTTFAGGVIRISAACQRPGNPASMRMAMEGSFTATQLDSALRVEVTGPGANGRGTQTVRMTGTMTGRRLGDCPATGSAPVRVPPAPPPPPSRP